MLSNFSASASPIFLFVMCGLSPLSKLFVHTQALTIVRRMRIIVMTAKTVKLFRTGRYAGAWLGWYILASLKMKYARPQKNRKMVPIIPNVFSLRVQKAAMIRMKIVTGMAAIVRPCSALARPVTMTRNWTVNPRKKKKSNLSKVM